MPDFALERGAIALFEALLDLPEDEREAALIARTAADPKLRGRVEAMLIADRTGALRTGTASHAADEEVPPERIGAYRIEERIGRGGMGSIYRGARITGDFAHVVAIKIIKPGLLSESLVERFRRERELLASLSHPNIAQLHDGGETETGSPYFIMEYIDGLPLMEWAEANAPPREERQRLFRDICAAVAFAHRNLVVHRDLTPSNVLVTRDGNVKLIDFGIARPADEPGAMRDAGESSIGSLSLTPGYAAPERMTSSGVTTAADIYSLGKLLEKLLPPRPGDRELLAIVARATAPEPLDRYPTADALGADVAAWGDGFPVAAMAGGRRYRFGKFVIRHRAGVAAGVIALLLVVGAFAFTARAYSNAETARRAEAARFEELRSLARFMLFELNGPLERVAGNTQARATLADRAQRYLSALAASRGARDDLKLEAAQGFITLARAQGVPAQPNLGDTAIARANLERSIAMLRKLDLPPSAKAPDQVEGLAALAMIQAHTDADVHAAARTLAAAARLLGAVPAADHGPRWYGARRRLRHGQLEVAVLGQEPDEILRLAKLLEDEIGEWPAAMRRSRNADFDRAIATYHRALHGYFTDALNPAVDDFLRAEKQFAALDEALPNDPVTLYALMWNAYVGYGAASGLSERNADATHFLQLAMQTSERLLALEANDHSLRSFAGSLRQMQAQSFSAAGDDARAIAMQGSVIRLYQSELGPDRSASPLNRLAMAQITMGNIARAAGNRAAACSAYRVAGVQVAELHERDELVGTVGSYRPDLQQNIEFCEAGFALSKMKVLE